MAMVSWPEREERERRRAGGADWLHGEEEGVPWGELHGHDSVLCCCLCAAAHAMCRKKEGEEKR
jgi:hypothetical protein